MAEPTGSHHRPLTLARVALQRAWIDELASQGPPERCAKRMSVSAWTLDLLPHDNEVSLRATRRVYRA